MKKMYIQPTTEQFATQMIQALCDVSVDPNPTDGMTSEAPERGGEFFPL